MSELRLRPRLHPQPLPSEGGAVETIRMIFTQKWLKPRPESCLDCLISAEFDRQRSPKSLTWAGGEELQGYLAHKNPPP